MAYWLGIDCGGTWLKAGLYDREGREHAIVRQPLALISTQPGWAERDMSLLWQQCAQAIRDLLTQSATSGQAIRGVGISAQGKGLFLLDKQDRPLGNAILSSDRRAQDIVQRWQRDGVAQQLYPLTRQALWSGHPATLLRWLKEHQPQRYRQIGCVLMAHDYLRWCLSGVKGCELSNISESNLYNMVDASFDSRLTTWLGISEVEAALPPLVGSSEVCATVSAEAAALTGLLPGTPLVGGLFDVVATALCAGLRDEHTLNAVMGTWAVTSALAERLEEGEPYPYVYGHYAFPGRYIVHEASPTSAANLEWLRAQWGNLPLNEVNRLVDSVPRVGSDLFFLPFLYGSNAGASLTAGFYGLQALHQRAHLLQAVYEGVIFSHMTHLARMRTRFTQVRALRVTGGPARSPTWMQMLADASGLPVELPQVEETGCLGAAMMALAGSEGLSAAMCWKPPEVQILQPDPALYDAYQAKCQRYQSLTAALCAWHAQGEALLQQEEKE
ncbi:FGGY-family carbohydrate kinase [Edwardsiella anguillarum]|uniref:FGGY-family carbohydrate kinase n=1 Tax=Edwardsiella anguillarum TaxID=1821960 RepID=UPI0024B7A919|nr:FGGY-family carbohydrate kinase [Edwardsiella anguillarum]WHP79864.1 carbohydrate kinase [Edwardsiella anguillarum]WHQ17325.1 carbohydrate kinase [Edwardsiella anguillarum]WHQ20862.1 carbohydrate kinase [Edwardsiella anguillarum]WHQ24384.1 carbohydrate kinase [Edwardsiella anguillarum]WHQ27953.1 carbohydrate kinase [Edwardsiella anguillarum]